MPFGQSRPSAAKRGARGQIAQGKIHFLMEKKGENGGREKSTPEIKNGANIHAKAAEKRPSIGRAGNLALAPWPSVWPTDDFEQ